MSNPFVVQGRRVDTVDIRNALSDIKKDLENCQELVAKSERSISIDDEIQMVLALSGLEVKMTNFAKDMRERFA